MQAASSTPGVSEFPPPYRRQCAGRSLHLVVDNYATHKHPKTRAWLAKRPRFHVHFTPTYASWLNQVERWFGLITQRQIRRGSFVSAKDLIAKIDAFVQAYNAKATPFRLDRNCPSHSR